MNAWDERGHQMELSSEQYSQIVSWMDQQQRRVTELEVENRELRRQLDELRRGVGISLVIEGRSIPAAALQFAGPDSAHAASLSAGQHPAYQRPIVPASASDPTYPIPPQYAPPVPHAAPSQPMRREMLATPPLPAGRRGTAAPDSAWLTGQVRAVRAPVTHAADTNITGTRRISTPSQDMTPTWLREEKPLPAPNVPLAPSSWPSRPITAGPKPRTLASATGKQAAVRAPSWPASSWPAPPATPVPAPTGRPVAPRLEPERIPSLAQMTGHRPDARLSGAPRVERSPFSDSFVLG